MSIPEGSFNPKFMKVCQNVNHDNIEIRFETGSCWVNNYVARSNLKKTVCTL